MRRRRKNSVVCACSALIVFGCLCLTSYMLKDLVWEAIMEKYAQKDELPVMVPSEEKTNLLVAENTVMAGKKEAREEFTEERTEEKETRGITEEGTLEPAESAGEVLHFIDAWEEWHDMVIDEKIPKHDYNFTLLKNTGQDVDYVGDKEYYVRKGVDVSYHQGTIDWARVRNSGIEFAFIRIGYRGYGQNGKLREDSQFKENIVSASQAGLDVGVYLFSQAINEEEALEEAHFVIDQLQEAGVALTLPVVYDPELIRDDKARTDHISGKQFTENSIVFCEKIKEAGYEPMIYSNMVWEAFYFDLNRLTDYQIWYADYEKIPQTPYWFSFWQYSCNGKVDGISGRVDLNLQFIAEQEQGE